MPDINTIIDLMEREDEDGLYVWFGDGWMGEVARTLREQADDEGFERGYAAGFKDAYRERAD